MSKHLVTKDSTQKMARGIVRKLTKTKGEVVSKKNTYKFKIDIPSLQLEKEPMIREETFFNEEEK